MAKKNANKRSKTATEKTLSSSEPRIQVLAKWSGMNISNLAPGWTPSEDYDSPDDFDNTIDEELKQWVIQNNMFCCDNGSIETRRNTRTVSLLGSDDARSLSGPVLMHKQYVYVADDRGGVLRGVASGATGFTALTIDHKDYGASLFTDLCMINNRLIATTSTGLVYTGDFVNGVCSNLACARPISDAALSASSISVAPVGLTTPGCPTAIGFCYSLSNRFGNTRGSQWTDSVVYNLSPAEFNHNNHLSITINLPEQYTRGQDTVSETKDITGVDVYCHIDDAQDAIYVGHVNVPNGATSVNFKWLGAINSLASWAMAPLTIPMENVTGGPHGKYCEAISDRLYVWGGPQSPYRIYFGGNPGNEIQFNRGTGGGWMDSDTQQFTQLYDLHTFKVWKANILTILGDQPNTGQSPRYNLIEHNMAITNEIQVKGMFLERIENVLGVKNRNASIVLFDGLYSINRYGVGLTTMPMSSNVEDKQEYISDAIKPVFQEYLSSHLNNAKMSGYKKSIYFALGSGNGDELDNIIFCYNIPLKAWFTYTLPEIIGGVKNLFSIDNGTTSEGLGVVTTKGVYLVEEFGEKKPDDAPPFKVHLETGQISSKQPLQVTSYLEQIELRFDYIVGDLDVTINYMDYWGRKNKVTKHISVATLRRNWSEWIRFGTYVESYNIQIVGKARFRLTHFMCKVYPQGNRVGLVYGLDDRSSRRKIHGGKHEDIHHYIDSYNNLRDSIVP